MAFSRDKINKIITKMRSKSNRNGIRESMAQILQEVLSSDDLGGGSINPESAFRLVRVSSATENFVKVRANVVQDEEWYVVSDNPTADEHFDRDDNARQYVKKVLDADNNATYVFEKPKNADVIVFYDDEHEDDVSEAAVAMKDIYVYENNAWVKINARFTNYNAANSTITGKWANVEGNRNTASGESSHAEGLGCKAIAGNSHAEGYNTTASGQASHAEGQRTTASGFYSHAEGSDTKAVGNYSHAEGNFTLALGHNSSSHGFKTAAQHDNNAAFGKNAVVGDTETYFGVGWGDSLISDTDQRLDRDLNLHLSVKTDGRVLNKDGNEFITADAVATEIDEKLNVYSGEGDADATFDIFQVTGTAPVFTNPSIIIEKSKNPSQIWVRYSDENKFFDYLNYLKGKEIHLIESGETVSTQQIIITGFAEQVDTFNTNTANEYHQRQITGFSSTPDINIIPTENTKTTYYYNKHTPIRLLVDNNSNHIRTIEQELTHADTTNLSDANNFATLADTDNLNAAKLYADTQDAAHSNDDRAFTSQEISAASVTLANADATTLQSAKDYADDNDKFVDSITLDNTDDGKIKLGYNDDSTGLELDWLPNPGNGAGALTLLKVENDASGKKRLLGSASSDVTAEINSLNDSAANNLKIRGTLIQTGTIAEETLTTAVQTKLNASGGGSDTNHFVKVVRKEGTTESSVSDGDYYVENVVEIVQQDEYYIVNPTLPSGSTIPSTEAGKFAIKGSDNTISYTAPRNGDTAFIFADMGGDTDSSSGGLSKIVAILIYEGDKWIITNSYFKTGYENTETGLYANTEGSLNTASGVASHAEGFGTTASADYAHAEGTSTTASAAAAHAEGNETTASALSSHAEGNNTTASASFSHAEGNGTEASGSASHAEGNSTIASGVDSHAQGSDTVAKTDHSTISGKNGVVAASDTLIGIAWGTTKPTDAQKTGNADVGLVWKVDQSGNTTQTGKVIAASFEKPDGTTIAKGDKGDPGDGSGNAALEALTRDMEWKVEVQEYNNAETPASPATIGIAYSGTNVDFVFPTATSKADVDALVIDRNFAFELPEGIVAFTPTSYESSVIITGGHHRERYAASVTLDNGVAADSDTNNNYQTTLYRSTIGHTIILPNPGTNDGAKDIPIVKRVNGELILANSTPVEVIEEINGISPGSANTTGLQGHALRNDTIPESKLDAAVKTKLNDTPDLTAYATTTATNTKISGIKIKERRVRVFANSAFKKTGTAIGGWAFTSGSSGFLNVGESQETPPDPDNLRFKGLSIEVPIARWNTMDNIIITSSHAGQIAMTAFPPIMKDDLRAGEANKVRVGVSGTSRQKMNLYFEEGKNQLGVADANSNRLVIEMEFTDTDQQFYIGEVIFTHLETTTS